MEKKLKQVEIMDLHEVQCVKQLKLLLLLAECRVFIINYANGGHLNINEISVSRFLQGCYD